MRSVLIGAMVMIAAAASAADGQWFQHEWGERRAYFGDWLAACKDRGEGECRLVQTSVHEGSNAFFDQRLALLAREDGAGWVVEVMDRNMPGSDVSALTFTIDGDVLEAPAGSWQPGDFESGGASDTVSVTEAAFAATLVEKLSAGNSVSVTYAPAGSGRGSANFPLRGVTAGAKAIAQIYDRR